MEMANQSTKVLLFVLLIFFFFIVVTIRDSCPHYRSRAFYRNFAYR